MEKKIEEILNPIWDGSRAVTGVSLELLADFRTLKEMRKKFELKAKDYRKIGEVRRSTRMTKKPFFSLPQTGKNMSYGIGES